VTASVSVGAGAGSGRDGRARVAVVPGDGAAAEAVHATLHVLEALALPVELDVLPDGAELARSVPAEEREAVLRRAMERADTVLYGATGGVTGGLGYLRFERATYANVRPIRFRAGVPSPLRSPEGIDYVIVRENLEGAYCGIEGDLSDLRRSGLDLRPFGGLVSPRHDPTAGEGRFAVAVTSRAGAERVAQAACRLALVRLEAGGRGLVTTGAKWNVLSRSDRLFRDVVEEVVAGHPELRFEAYLADDLARRLVAEPQAFDVVVLPNLYGDLFSDLGAATVGGLGVVPSGCYGDDFAYFEPVHGSAPDIAGRGIVNPTATLLSAVMLLDHLGLVHEARRLEGAVDTVLEEGRVRTPDLGGASGTAEFAEAVRAAL
jgi:isocitrate/isopropylmalate dehydrogenase